MITTQQVEELAPLYEEYMHAENPETASVRQAKLVFDSLCRRIYAAESEGFRSKLSFQAFVAGTVVQEVLRHLNQRASKFPTIQPERKS